MKKVFFFIVLALTMGFTAQAQQTETKPLVQHITYQDFLDKIWDFEKNPDEVVFKGKTIALVDFYADWCGPCRKLGPILEGLADEYDDELTVYKINVDQEKILASVFQVRSIPMVLIFPMKGQPTKLVGAYPEQEYVKIIEKMIMEEEAMGEDD